MRLWGLLLFLGSASLQAQTITREQLSELHQIRSEIKTTVFDQARYKQDILKAKLDIQNQNQEIQKNQKEAGALKEQILNRVETLYKIRRAYPEGTWLSFAKEGDFQRKNYYLNYLNSQDSKLVSDYRSRVRSTHKLKEKSHAYMKRLQLLREKNKERFVELQKQEIKQRALIRQIKESLRTRNQNRPLTEEANAPFFSELRGRLEPPLKGELRGAFGLRRNPATRLATLQTGIVVSSQPGEAVQSIYAGEVLYTGNVEGWGPTIVVDHGESYYSVYSHIQNLSVRPGDRVQAHQKLAEVAAVAYHNQSADSGLYFEIRHYSEPEDPRVWLKGVHHEETDEITAN